MRFSDQQSLIAKENDYVLALKGNHGNIYADVVLYMDQEIIGTTHKTVEKNHGRLEIREYFLETDIAWLPDKDKWAKLNAIGAVRSTLTIGGKTTMETRYFITTLTDVEIFAKAVRSHWGVGNSLH